MTTRYDYFCDKCGITEEHMHGMTETPEISCPECGNKMERLISLSAGGFTIKGGTSSIHSREKENRRKRSEEMGRRQRERYGTPKTVKPNIAGIETGTWEKAHTIAQEIKKDTGIFPETYAPLAAKEKEGKIIVTR
jgi:putative FmdB family regulatory protein